MTRIVFILGASAAALVLSAGYDGSAQGPPAPTPYVSPAVPAAAAAAIGQTTHGTRTGIALAESFDGLGLGFRGPQGVAQVNNPSDNSLAVGPNHIVQTVNGAGMAIFTKKGRTFKSSGTVL